MKKRIYEGNATGIYEPMAFSNFVHNFLNSEMVVQSYEHPERASVFHIQGTTVLYTLYRQSLPQENVQVTLHGQPKKIETLEARIKKEDAKIRRATRR